jgi:hypothetical protein
VDISSECSYPPPPDRKLLAAQRAQNLKARATRESLSEEQSDPLTGPNLLSEDHSALLHNSGQPNSLQSSEFGSVATSRDSVSSTPPSHPIRKTLLQSREVALFLFEIYFSRLYNASLLYHKETLLLDYRDGRMPEFVSLSIFALASM